jgi:hypothetical protein
MDLEFKVKVRSTGYLDPQTIHNNLGDSIVNYGLDTLGRAGDGPVDEVIVTAAPTNPGPLTPTVCIRPERGEPGNDNGN